MYKIMIWEKKEGVDGIAQWGRDLASRRVEDFDPSVWGHSSLMYDQKLTSMEMKLDVRSKGLMRKDWVRRFGEP